MTTRRQIVTALPLFALPGLAGRLRLDPGPARAQDAAAGPEGLVRHRSIEAMIWGMPAVNLDLMYQSMLRETACARQSDALLVEAPLL